MFRTTLFACVLSVALSAPSAAQTADEIVARSFAAQGGLDRIKSVNTVRMTGHMVVGPGMEAPLVLEMKRPKSMRLDMTIQGMTIVQAFDGTTAWMINPTTGRSAAEALPAEMAKLAEEQADMDGPLVDYQAKGNAVELLGKESVAGSDCYVLKITERDGDVSMFFLDATTYLTVKQETRRTMGGVEVVGETFVGDWKEVGGMLFPHSIDTGQKGAEQRQRMTIQRIDVNPAIDPARFTMPR